ncbi:hypothetical protein [Flammeovirga aprica]|uniref:Uncharacterized protein n=1 Tax=Flammeovirga aprica JL-4 TaxID=694437 RepID=A0A7X9RZB1_9BACT|nr:hypothetical protein [Flammeovirga aprica]NME71464.1 hypothetical protein [Flammeovirga aprica JL-4]
MKSKITTTVLYFIFATAMTFFFGSLSSCSKKEESNFIPQKSVDISLNSLIEREGKPAIRLDLQDHNVRVGEYWEGVLKSGESALTVKGLDYGTHDCSIQGKEYDLKKSTYLKKLDTWAETTFEHTKSNNSLCFDLKTNRSMVVVYNSNACKKVTLEDVYVQYKVDSNNSRDDMLEMDSTAIEEFSTRKGYLHQLKTVEVVVEYDDEGTHKTLITKLDDLKEGKAYWIELKNKEDRSGDVVVEVNSDDLFSHEDIEV